MRRYGIYAKQVDVTTPESGVTKDYTDPLAKSTGSETASDDMVSEGGPVVTAMREFHTGATRHSDEGKLDYEGFFSPHVLKRYAEYMNKHGTQADGKVRGSDDWQQGIPRAVYMKSMLRHLMDVWGIHRQEDYDPSLRDAHETALCALMFNTMGYLFEILKEKARHPEGPPLPEETD